MLRAWPLAYVSMLLLIGLSAQSTSAQTATRYAPPANRFRANFTSTCNQPGIWDFMEKVDEEALVAVAELHVKGPPTPVNGAYSTISILIGSLLPSWTLEGLPFSIVAVPPVAPSGPAEAYVVLLLPVQDRTLDVLVLCSNDNNQTNITIDVRFLGFFNTRNTSAGFTTQYTTLALLANVSGELLWGPSPPLSAVALMPMIGIKNSDPYFNTFMLYTNSSATGGTDHGVAYLGAAPSSQTSTATVIDLLQSSGDGFYSTDSAISPLNLVGTFTTDGPSFYMLDYPIRWIDSNSTNSSQAIKILPPSSFTEPLGVGGLMFDGQALAANMSSVALLVSIQAAADGEIRVTLPSGTQSLLLSYGANTVTTTTTVVPTDAQMNISLSGTLMPNDRLRVYIIGYFSFTGPTPPTTAPVTFPPTLPPESPTRTAALSFYPLPVPAPVTFEGLGYAYISYIPTNPQPLQVSLPAPAPGTPQPEAVLVTLAVRLLSPNQSLRLSLHSCSRNATAITITQWRDPNLWYIIGTLELIKVSSVTSFSLVEPLLGVPSLCITPYSSGPSSVTAIVSLAVVGYFARDPLGGGLRFNRNALPVPHPVVWGRLQYWTGYQTDGVLSVISSAAPDAYPVSVAVRRSDGQPATAFFVSVAAPTGASVKFLVQGTIGANPPALLGSFDSVGRSIYGMTTPIRLVDTGGSAPALTYSIAAPIDVSGVVESWADSLLCSVDVYAGLIHGQGELLVNGNFAMQFATDKHSVDTLIVPIVNNAVKFDLHMYFFLEGPPAISVDCFAFFGMPPPLPPPIETGANLGYIPLPVPVRLVDTYSQPQLQAWQSAMAITPTSAYTIPATDVRFAVDISGLPRVMTCVIALYVEGASAYLWSDATVIPAYPTLSCVGRVPCSTSATVLLNTAGQFYLRLTGTGANQVTIDVTGFYYERSQQPGANLWHPISGIAATAVPVSAAPLPAFWPATAPAYTYAACVDAIANVTFVNLWSSAINPIGSVSPTPALSVATPSGTAFSGVAMGPDLALGAACVPAGCALGGSLHIEGTGYFNPDAVNGGYYTPLDRMVRLTIGSVIRVVGHPEDTDNVTIPPCDFVVALVTGAQGTLSATRRDNTSQPVVLAPLLPSGLITVEAYLPILADGTITLSGDLSPIAIFIVGYVGLTPTPTTTPPLPTTQPPPSTVPPLTPTPAPPSTQPNTQPTGVPTSIPCVTPPPANEAVCVGGAWWVPRIEQPGSWNLTFEPIIIGETLTLKPTSVTVITPTANSTIFIVVEGTANIDGSLIVDLSGRNYTSTYTTLAVVRAQAIDGGFNVIKVDKAPKGCTRYSAWTAQSQTTLNAVLLRDDSGCGKGSGVGKWGAIAGGVVFGVTLLGVAIFVILLKFGCISRSSSVLNSGDKEKLVA